MKMVCLKKKQTLLSKNSKLNSMIKGGNVTLDDLRDYRAIVHENNYVIRLDNVHRMYVPPPPSSGILVAFIMKLMKGNSKQKKVVFLRGSL